MPAVQPAAEQSPPVQSPVRTAAAGLIGNVLEWFDYGVFGFFSAEIGQHFTPATMDPSEKRLVTFAIFWMGFLARPIGGLMLGPIGDRIGRRALLTLSIVLMGAATLSIGLLPSYETIGFAAPALLLLLRLIQGFSLGGEFTGSMVYTTELASPFARGLIASSTAAGTTLGFFLGLLTAWIISVTLGPQESAEWGWRIPFVASVLLVIAGWLLRRGIQESEQGVKSAQQRAPIFSSLLSDWKPIAQTFGIVSLTNAAYYLTFTFAVERRRIEDSDFQLMTLISLGVVLVAKVFGGWLSDRWGRRSMMIGLTVIMLLALHFALDLMLRGTTAMFFVGQLMLAIPLGMALGLQGSMVVEIFPLRTRVTSMSFAYGATLALSGGIVPLVSTALIDKMGSLAAPAYFVMLYGLIGLPIMIAMRETNRRSLDV
jgi:MHS family proline/betaine transporter-like MFS transporter